MRVFVSSTSEDLRAFRGAAADVILGFGWHPVMMEHFGTDTKRIIDVCGESIRKSDLMLLLIAHRLGWVPSKRQGGNGKKSIVQLEFEHAQRCAIPVLALVADEDWPGQFWEDEHSNREAVRNFKKGINLPCIFFSFERPIIGDGEPLPQFQAKVRQELLRHQLKVIEREIGSKGAGDPTKTDVSDQEKSLAGGNYVHSGAWKGPLLGAGFTLSILLPAVLYVGNPKDTPAPVTRKAERAVQRPAPPNHPILDRCDKLHQIKGVGSRAWQECYYVSRCRDVPGSEQSLNHCIKNRLLQASAEASKSL